MKAIKFTVKTPKGKAKASMRQFDFAIHGYSLKKNLDKGIIDDQTFYMIVGYKTEEEKVQYELKGWKAEASIKAFYGSIFRLLHRCDKIANKCNWGLKKIKNWFIKQYKKKINQNAKQFEEMPDEEFKKFLKPTDEKEMTDYLASDIVKTEVIEWKKKKKK